MPIPTRRWGVRFQGRARIAKTDFVVFLVFVAAVPARACDALRKSCQTKLLACSRTRANKVDLTHVRVIALVLGRLVVGTLLCRDGIADASPSHLHHLRWGFGVNSVPKDESALNVIFPSNNTEGTSG